MVATFAEPLASGSNAGEKHVRIEDAQGTMDVVFSNATTAEERIRCSKLASTAFGKSLSQDEYLEREDYLGRLPLTRDSGWRFWCLTRADDPKQVLTMCKTMHRDMLVRDAQGIRKEQGYCIASVVTDSRYRGRSLATILLENVAEWMDGPGNAISSMLYSDVGEFYVGKGWGVLDSSQSILRVSPSLSRELAGFPKSRPLTKEDIPKFCERDIEDLKKDFRDYDLPPDSLLTTVLPTMDVVGWLQSRAEFMGNKTIGKVPDIKGSICESVGTWLYWYHDFNHKKLNIQRVKLAKGRSDIGTQSLAVLLLDALNEAARWNFSKVVIWNPGPEVRSAMQPLGDNMGVGVSHEVQESELPCLRWKGKEKRSVMVWPNEFYGWS
ncbi:hypothetical protein F4779DRAFT_105611 [Xylariaceae sp. FL0662B]|nr:hypothetical protein F4779DRAFT_105611 [Xylariaceae sp. FL0662B]